jgi:hypothetical protein
MCAIETVVQTPATIFNLINVLSAYNPLHVSAQLAGALRKRNAHFMSHVKDTVRRYELGYAVVMNGELVYSAM